MTIEKFSTILYQECYDRIGHIGNIEFSIDSAPFENSKKKYCAYLLKEYNGDFYFDTLEELLKATPHISRKMIKQKKNTQQIDRVYKKYPILCSQGKPDQTDRDVLSAR